MILEREYHFKMVQELYEHKHAVNVSRNPRKRIGYCIAFGPSTNCSIITISRRVPDTQRRGKRRGRRGGGQMPRKQIEIRSSSEQGPYRSESAQPPSPVLPVNYGEDRAVCGTRYGTVFRGLPNTAAETERCGDWIRDN